MNSKLFLSTFRLAGCLSILAFGSVLGVIRSLDEPAIYQNPFMATNNFSEIHNNSFQTDTISVAGPGRSGSTTVDEKVIGPVPFGIGGTIAFNSSGQLITIRQSVASDSKLSYEILLIDPDSLQVLARESLPSGENTGASSGTLFSGGGYFYLDNVDRVVCVTTSQEIRIYELDTDHFNLVTTYDLSTAIGDTTDILNSVLPDNLGNLWFITSKTVVGFVDTDNSTIRTVKITDISGTDPNETNSKSFASDDLGGVFIVTDHALYRFQRIGFDPSMTWRVEYDRGTRKKSGQNQQGSGTTPTLFDDFSGNQFVAIADNADPFLHVLVYDRNTGELIIEQEVFTHLPYLNSCENSLIAMNRSIVIENNYGNSGILAIFGPETTRPGLARVDFNPTTKESSVKWENRDIAIPSVVTQLSTEDGLIYTYAKDKEGWYWAAVDFRFGTIVSTARIPRIGKLPGPLANNFYAGLNIGPDGTAYVSVFGGITAWRPE